MMLIDLGEWLVGQGHAVEWAGTDDGSSWYLFRGVLPDSPHRVVTLAEDQGKALEAMGNSLTGEVPRLQVIVRGNPDHDYLSPRKKVYDIWRAFGTLGSITINGTEYSGTSQVGTIIPMERDKSNRVLFSANFQVTKGLDAGGYA